MNTKLKLVSRTNKSFEILIPETNRSESIFVLAGHKTGSSLMNKLVHDICRTKCIPEVAIGEQTFKAGLVFEEWPDSLTDLMERPGYVFSALRFFDGCSRSKSFWKSKKILLIRDPRDCICSHYFSVRYSHWLPVSGSARENLLSKRELLSRQEIDEFVVSGQADWTLENYNKMLQLLGRGDTILYRYEDVIFNKVEWVKSLSQVLGAELTDMQTTDIASKHDIVPETENPSNHVRKVTPGDYLEKLSAETIKYVEDKCSGYFTNGFYERFPRPKILTLFDKIKGHLFN